MDTRSSLSLKSSAFLALTMAAVAQSAWSADPVRIVPDRISLLEAGWAEDTVAVQLHGVHITNPAGCPHPEFGFVTSPSDRGRRLYQDMLRDAFWHNWPVELLISGTPNDCPFGKPRIISVTIRR